ncbi:hypothetical protein CMV_026351 [Castanea mollissima]|uniref:Uncharacterized protein n=1 Tax=Castanea mollissima TaxID=60419 RepID=A0A8J4QHG4_9ROSI|nr:hypothetical protein CMV_026351 [Castanea mollissima]
MMLIRSSGSGSERWTQASGISTLRQVPIGNSHSWCESFIGVQERYKWDHGGPSSSSSSEKSGVVMVRGIGGNHGSIEIDIGRMEMVEDKASVRKVGERKCAETDELKGIELGLGMA